MDLFIRSVELFETLFPVQTTPRKRFVHIVGRFVLLGVVPSHGKDLLNGVVAGFSAIEAYLQLLGFDAPFG